ncbi:MAG: hypothetical protein A2Z09_00710 [Nitrospirae bacterium RBG_16_43_8]|nr:MAG: hypothetical protein A2Z09_00710 [Nitrospirae bacterium RBG_16_43_8]
MVTIANPRIIAFESGFTGQRAETTWKGRMKTLVDLGFINSKPGAVGPYHYVLILNPYAIIKELKEKGERIPEHIYNALLDRTREIGANDML